MAQEIREYMQFDALAVEMKGGTPEKGLYQNAVTGWCSVALETYAAEGDFVNAVSMGQYNITGVVTPDSGSYDDLYVIFDRWVVDDSLFDAPLIPSYAITDNAKSPILFGFDPDADMKDTDGSPDYDALVQLPLSSLPDFDMPIAVIRIYEDTNGSTPTGDTPTYTGAEVRNRQYGHPGGSTFSSTLTPRYEHTIKTSDIVEIFKNEPGDEFRNINLKLPGKSFKFVADAGYIVTFTYTESFLKSRFGIKKRTANVDNLFMPQYLKISGQTLPPKVFLNGDNEVAAVIQYRGSPIDLKYFDSFELHNFGDATLDSTVDDFLYFGDKEGEIVLKLNGHASTPGTYNTTLIGFESNDHPDGVVLWHPNLANAKFNVEVI